MTRRKSIIWAVSIAFLLFLMFPGEFLSIREKVSDAVADAMEESVPDQGAPPVDLGPGRTLVEFSDQLESGAFQVAASPGGKSVAASWQESGKSIIALFDQPQGRVVWRIETNSYGERGVAFSPDGQTLAIGQQPGIKLLDPSTGKEQDSLGDTEANYARLVFSADGRRILAGGELSLDVWDVGPRRKLAHFKMRSMQPSDIAISPDGKSFASASMGPMRCRSFGLFGMGGVGCGPKGGRINIWDGPEAEEPVILETRGRAYSVAFQSDGPTLASGSFDGVRLWDLASRKGRKILGIPGFSLAFSPDGRTLAIGTGDAFNGNNTGEVRLWDLASQRSGQVLKGKLGTIRCLAFSPDGGTLVAGGRKGIAVWTLPKQQQPGG